MSRLDKLLDDVRHAAEFFRRVEACCQAGEDCTSTGAWKDANDWLKTAALALGEELRRRHGEESSHA